MIADPTLHTPMWLSHHFSEATPLYGGEAGIEIHPDRVMCQGDSCNTSKLILPNHSGSHVDAPKHFIDDGNTITDYGPADWVFNNPHLLDISVKPRQLLGKNDFKFLSDIPRNVDLLLIRTGFEEHRGEDLYWNGNPALHSELAEIFKSSFPHLKAIGLDTISVSSTHHRVAGRLAHTAFLREEIRLFEDLSLACVSSTESLIQVVALPLMIMNSDGAPCTVLGWEKTTS
jgi:arylformamidase